MLATSFVVAAPPNRARPHSRAVRTPHPGTYGCGPCLGAWANSERMLAMSCSRSPRPSGALHGWAGGWAGGWAQGWAVGFEAASALSPLFFFLPFLEAPPPLRGGRADALGGGAVVSLATHRPISAHTPQRASIAPA